MFTGLIKDIGKVVQVNSNNEGREFIIETNALCDQIAIDDSVATNGVCLTATQINGNRFKVQAVHVTLEKTTIGDLKTGSKVNLELALRPIDRLGGHLVQGHVNGRGKITEIKKLGKNYEMTFSTEQNLFKYIIKEGSISLDGVSLTIARLTNTTFTVSLIPHTWDNTILHTKKIGDLVNIEVDMMAKYLENFLRFENKDNSNNRLMNLMKE